MGQNCIVRKNHSNGSGHSKKRIPTARSTEPSQAATMKQFHPEKIRATYEPNTSKYGHLWTFMSKI